MGKMSEQAASRVFEFPGLANEIAPEDKERWSWFARRLYEAGVLEMAPSTNRPAGFYVNWTTVTSIVVILGAIISLWYFTWQSAKQSGFEQGKFEAEKQQLIERLKKAEDDAAEAKKFSIYATAGADEAAGHKPNQKEKK